MNALEDAIAKAEGFVHLGIGDDAWEALEDLPTEFKNHPRVLELRLEALVCLRNWPMAEILGESIVRVLPGSVSVWLSLARIKAQLGKREQALQAMSQVTALDVSRRLEMVDDELLAPVW